MLNDTIYEMIEKLTKTGKIFSANFTKKDGTERTMVCRVGVSKHLKGKGLGYDAKAKRNLIVFDMNKGGYRTIPVDRLNWIKIEGDLFKMPKVFMVQPKHV